SGKSCASLLAVLVISQEVLCGEVGCTREQGVHRFYVASDFGSFGMKSPNAVISLASDFAFGVLQRESFDLVSSECENFLVAPVGDFAIEACFEITGDQVDG